MREFRVELIYKYVEKEGFSQAKIIDVLEKAIKNESNVEQPLPHEWNIMDVSIDDNHILPDLMCPHCGNNVFSIPYTPSLDFDLEGSEYHED